MTRLDEDITPIGITAYHMSLVTVQQFIQCDSQVIVGDASHVEYLELKVLNGRGTISVGPEHLSRVAVTKGHKDTH